MSHRAFFIIKRCIWGAVWVLIGGVSQDLRAAVVVPHSNFVLLREIDLTIQQVVRYATSENFLGRPVEGYRVPEIVSTRSAAEALSRVQTDLQRMGYELVVYDGYRPQRAVDTFIAWSRNSTDQTAKDDYYPTIRKEDVFELGYLAKRSSHSRGSTFDLSVIPLGQKVHAIVRSSIQVGQETLPFLDDGTLPMGTSFDLFHDASHHNSPLIDEITASHRNILRDAMIAQGFAPYAQEWWHYTLKQEPYPDTYFDFVVEDDKNEEGSNATVDEL